MLKIDLIKSPGIIGTCNMCDGQKLEIHVDGENIEMVCKECGAKSNVCAEVV